MEIINKEFTEIVKKALDGKKGESDIIINHIKSIKRECGKKRAITEVLLISIFASTIVSEEEAESFKCELLLHAIHNGKLKGGINLPIEGL